MQELQVAQLVPEILILLQVQAVAELADVLQAELGKDIMQEAEAIQQIACGHKR